MLCKLGVIEMDIDELSQLNNTNFFLIVSSFLGSFNKTTNKNYEKLLSEHNADYVIKEESSKEVYFHFKHDSIAYANMSLDFKKGKLVNFRAQIVPVGFFKGGVAKQYRNQILDLLNKIGEYTGSEVEVLKKDSLFQLLFENKLVKLNMDKNIQNGNPYVSVWCEYV